MFQGIPHKVKFLRYDFIVYSKSLDIPKYYVSSFMEIQPLLIKLQYFE